MATTMDHTRHAELLADLRRFLELARQDYFGEWMPDGMLYRRACEAVDELERMTAATMTS